MEDHTAHRRPTHEDSAKIPQGHTPGPWHVNEYGSTDVVGTSVSGGDRLVADCRTSNRERLTDHANARLTAAGPDMLSALKIVEAFWKHRGPLAQVGAEGQIVKHVQDAIAKAEGQS